MKSAHDYRAHHSQAARLMVEAQQLESAAQSIRLMACDLEGIAHGALASGQPAPEIIEARECARRAQGELQAALEMLSERRASMWQAKAVRLRREIDSLTTGGR